VFVGCGGGGEHEGDSSSSSCSRNESDLEEDELEMVNQWPAELEHKKLHPERLHLELWFNEEGEVSGWPI